LGREDDGLSRPTGGLIVSGVPRECAISPPATPKATACGGDEKTHQSGERPANHEVLDLHGQDADNEAQFLEGCCHSRINIAEEGNRPDETPDDPEEPTGVRWSIALILTLLTTALSLAVMAVTGVAGCFLWPAIILLSAGLGRLCRRSPLARVAYGFPFAGLLAGPALELIFNPTREPDYAGSLMIILALSLPLWAIYTGYLRAIPAGGGADVAEVMKADEMVRD
jgi:hypothetical protein